MKRILAVVIVLVLSAETFADPINVYWTNRNGATVSRTSVPGGQTTVIVPGGFNRLQDIDLDASSGTLYFSDWGPVGPPGGQGTISSVNRDGTGLGTVFNTGDAVHQLALDPANSRLYFTRAVSYDAREISRVDYSGANYTTLHSGAGSGSNGWFYSGLALDSANGLLYWGDIGVLTPAPPADGAVNSMTIAGAAKTTLSPHVDGRGRGFAFDAATNTIFLTSHDFQTPGSGGAVFSYDITNNILTQLHSDPTTGFWDIEIDPTTNRIWFTDFNNGQILSANFDGSDLQIELSGLDNPYGLALEFATEPIPEPTSLAIWSLLGLVGAGYGWRKRRAGR